MAVLDFEGNAKTHVPLREPKKSPEQRSENLSSPDLDFPTITNSLRRDEAIKTYPGKTSLHLALPFARSSIKFMQKLPNVSRKSENIPIPTGMTCVHGYWNKALQKWITYRDSSSQEELETQDAKSKRKLAKKTRKRKKKIMSRSTWKQKYDVYDRYDETDTEFETGGRDGKRMSFREFHHKKMMVELSHEESS